MPIAADALISYSALGQGAGNAVPPPLSLYVRALINFQTKKITFKITNAHLSCVDLTTKAAATGQTNVSVAVRACVRRWISYLLAPSINKANCRPWSAFIVNDQRRRYSPRRSVHHRRQRGGGVRASAPPRISDPTPKKYHPGHPPVRVEDNVRSYGWNL